MKIKFTMSKANHDAKAAKKASAPCSQYVTDIAAAKDAAGDGLDLVSPA